MKYNFTTCPQIKIKENKHCKVFSSGNYFYSKFSGLERQLRALIAPEKDPLNSQQSH